MTLQEARDLIGHKVAYRPTVGKVEEGVITAVNTAYVFVRYGGDMHSKATRPEVLETIGLRASGSDG